LSDGLESRLACPDPPVSLAARAPVRLWRVHWIGAARTNILDRVCRDGSARSSPVGNRSRFDIARAGNIPVPDRSGRDSRVGGGQALDSVGGRHRKIEPTPGQSCSEGLPLRALPTQTVSSRQPCWELSLHLNQRLTALANCVPTRSAVAARRSEVLISSVGCQNESISPPHLISALEL